MNNYKKYINTGVEWVGCIPEIWRHTQLKRITKITKGKKALEDFQDYQNGLIPYLGMDYLRNQTDFPIWVSESDPNIIIVEENDLLVLWDGSKSGEIVKAKYGALSSTMGKIQITSKRVNSKYLYYYLKKAEAFLQANTVGMGIPHVNGELLRTLFISIPSLLEQTQIVEFLDHKTSLIDQLITKKEQLINTLKDKKQSIINETVTKGLNPNARMSHSGVEWLGEIPEAWDLKRLKHLVSLNSNEELCTYKDEIYKIALENIESQTGKLIESSSENSFEGMGNWFKEGDVLFNKLRPYLAKVFLADRIGIAVSELLVLSPKDLLTSKYLFYRLISSSFIELINSSTYGAKMPRANWNFIGNTFISVPTIPEQEGIAQFLDKKLSLMNHTLEKVELAIEKLKEYRQSIISEAVTGKIDLRNWQPNNN